MSEMYRDEARVEHMHRAIKKIRQNLGKVDSATSSMIPIPISLRRLISTTTKDRCV